jgi:tetratricopeptide (TPR) repeat protein
VANLPPAQAALLLGHWHYDRQRWPAAVEQYEAALRLGIDNPDVRTDLGNCFRFLNQPEKAREQYERSQSQNPQHENSLFNLAALYAQVLHDHAKARELLNEYLRRFPDSDGAARARQLLAETGDGNLSPDTERLLRTLATDSNAPVK